LINSVSGSAGFADFAVEQRVGRGPDSQVSKLISPGCGARAAEMSAPYPPFPFRSSGVGYRSAAVLREQFVRRRGVSPSDYRRAFGRS
jgi:hypothetical protein